MLSARGGDVASIDVIIPAKNTGIAPGPILTDFKEVGVPTKINQGTVWITKDTTPVKKGETISTKLAALLGKLDIKPVEAGISLGAALAEGVHYSQEDLVVDVERYRNEFGQAHQQALSLSLEAAYVTTDNTEQILAMAAQLSRALSVETGFMTNETKKQLLQKGHSQAQGLIGKAKDYKPV